MKEEAVTIEALIEIIEQKDKTIAELQQKLDYMLRQKFASSSEKFPSSQPSLFQEDSTIEMKEDEETIKVNTIVKKD